MKFFEATAERYDEMLGCLPPAVWTGEGFLVGEPENNRKCTVTGRITPTFAAFFETGGKFYAAMAAMTPAEFGQHKAAEIAKEVEADTLADFFACHPAD